MKLYKTTEKVVSENYPYGYTLRTTKTDWIEYKRGHGFRHVSQTINPKTGRENKPKASTYYDILVLFKDEENGHTGSKAFSFYGHEDIDAIVTFFSQPENFALFTPEQIEGIYIRFLAYCKTDIYAQATYCGSKVEDLLPLWNAQIDTLVRGAKSKGTENVFPSLAFDWPKIDSYKVAGYQPFKVVSYGV